MSAATVHEFVPTQRTAPEGRPSHLVLVPEPVRRPAAPAAPLHITPRGRLVVLLALVAVGAVLAMVVSGLVGGSVVPSPAPQPTRTIVVQPGETLWSIARDVAPSADRRDTITRIVQLNKLPSTDVSAGVRLTVPAP